MEFLDIQLLGVVSGAAVCRRYPLPPAAAALALRVPPLLTWLYLMGFTADAVCSLRFLAVTHDLEALRRAI